MCPIFLAYTCQVMQGSVQNHEAVETRVPPEWEPGMGAQAVVGWPLVLGTGPLRYREVGVWPGLGSALHSGSCEVILMVCDNRRQEQPQPLHVGETVRSYFLLAA